MTIGYNPSRACRRRANVSVRVVESPGASTGRIAAASGAKAARKWTADLRPTTWPGASVPSRANLYPNVLGNSCTGMYLNVLGNSCTSMYLSALLD